MLRHARPALIRQMESEPGVELTRPHLSPEHLCKGCCAVVRTPRFS
jgi:hypothetical protein